ncbi:NAD(P)H-dependent oxidoreductase [Sphingomonas sp. MMSM20]|uniref:NAD(P)H-dependent oxidoreductase n=1 Tax=Sphingomonas lycopersici TaxID=2951807 RepID=UPI0022376845|nr:NAD(P)H-dependent oxidoreductase [Sphingomonas lycopersici]
MTDARTAIRHLVVCASPAPGGFGHAVVDAYVDTVSQAGQHAIVRDLYGIGFDPVLKADERPDAPHWAPSADVAAELEFARQADILVLVYPIWYGLPPAILKGYVDRVLGANYSFHRFRDEAGQPPLVGKPLLSFSTSGTPMAWLHERSQILALREIFDVYLWRGFGMKQSRHVMLDEVVANMPAAAAAEKLQRVRQAAAETCATLAGERPTMTGFEA